MTTIGLDDVDEVGGVVDVDGGSGGDKAKKRFPRKNNLSIYLSIYPPAKRRFSRNSDREIAIFAK
jgi:hypothetical protein